MKINKAVVQSEPPPRWGYLAFVVGMLYLLRRAKIKDIPREVRSKLDLVCTARFKT